MTKFRIEENSLNGESQAGRRKRPGGEISGRPLHIFFLTDASGSMGEHGKIQALNNAVREATPHMRSEADNNPHAEVYVRAISFANGARWHMAKATPIQDFEWVDLSANGCTDMGQALSMLAEQLKVDTLGDRGLPPVLILISDGQPTDSFDKGLKELMAQPWARKAVRLAVAIGRDAVHEPLQRFIGNSEIKPFTANNPEDLAKHIKWATTVPIAAASSPVSQPGNGSDSTTNVLLPRSVPKTNGSVSVLSVW